MIERKVSDFHCSISDPQSERSWKQPHRGMFNSPLHATSHSADLLSMIYFYKIFSSTNTLTGERCDRWALIIRYILYWSQLVPNNSLFIQNGKSTQSSSSLIRSTHAPTQWIFFLSFFILCIFSQWIFILFLILFLVIFFNSYGGFTFSMALLTMAVESGRSHPRGLRYWSIKECLYKTLAVYKSHMTWTLRTT